jgi:hypothetical protein
MTTGWFAPDVLLVQWILVCIWRKGCVSQSTLDEHFYNAASSMRGARLSARYRWRVARSQPRCTAVWQGLHSVIRFSSESAPERLRKSLW